MAPWAPLWFHEGIAGFWENTLIREDYVETGRPSDQYLQILKGERWMPLEELLRADRGLVTSLPAHRTSVFYAESWVLIHYMLIGDPSGRLKDAITPYLQLVMSGRTSTEAFGAAFGDLDEVEQQLRRYVRRYRFQALRVDKPQNIDADDYPVTMLSPDQFSARFGSYLVHTGANEEGRVALDHALELNPDNALANEALGVLQYRTDAREESRASFEKAASLDGTLYLPRYYLSLLEGPSRLDAEGVARVKSLLERAVQMNPFHAPSLARLAMLYVSTGEQTALALALARQAAAASPDYPFAYVAQGVAAKENGLMIEAGAALETSLRLAPDYELAQTELEEVKRIQQYPMSGAWSSEAGLWLQIDVDGTTLRCRLTRSGAARQTGTLAGSVITWTTPTADGTAVESSDNVELAGGQLRLESEQGEILLRRADTMPGACEPLFN